MCGISGVWGAPDIEAVKAMIATMNHRGPDDNGLYHDSQVVLGMTRLSVLDLSSEGHQPMCTQDKLIWIVYNGEVYNFQDERRLLENRGYEFSSRSDTEVVMRMYEHYGDDFLLRLRGMFALAVYDRRKGPGRERLLLARDPFGIKPLLYARVGNRLVFASELKALLASDLVKGAIDPGALRLLLTYGSVAQPRTMLAGVKMLMPAHRMIVEQSRQYIERYWALDIDRRPHLRARPYEEMVSEITHVLKESVQVHLISDAPVGAFLSGGIDSSLLIALMSRMNGQRVKTFSLGFQEEGAYDESPDAQMIAEYLNTDHTSVTVCGTDVRDHIGRIAFSLDQPSADGVNSYFVSRAAGRAVKVVLSGLGADEIFAGYFWFRQILLRQMNERRAPWSTLLKTALSQIAKQPDFDRLSLANRGGFLWKARNSAGFLTGYNKFINYSFGPVKAASLLHTELRESAQAGRSPEFDYEAFDELPNSSAIERVTGLTLRGYMTNQLLRDLDAVSMAHSLEVRVPYLDCVVADTALSIPDSAKLHGDSTGLANAGQTYKETGAKRILIDAGRTLLPKGFDLKPKRGFLLPQEAWLRGPLKDVLHETLSEHQARKRGFLDPKEVLSVKGDFLQHRLNKIMDWTKPWLLMMLELWCREVLDRPAAALADF